MSNDCIDDCCTPQAAAATHGPTASRKRELARRARLLSWASLVIVGGEALVGIAAGVVAMSWALIGFGVDSLIEGFASLVIVWRFQEHRIESASAERTAARLVAIQFFVLAPYISYEAIRSLVNGDRPHESLPGIVLAVVSMVSMPLLARAKIAVADEFGSAATRGEGQQNMLCAYMAAALLVSLLANSIFGIWWLDSTVALLIAALAVFEGTKAWRGELDCC
jgi:divalent metal cation (Fe/Co/Zn/Cd) transporter